MAHGLHFHRKSITFKNKHLVLSVNSISFKNKHSTLSVNSISFKNKHLILSLNSISFKNKHLILPVKSMSLKNKNSALSVNSISFKNKHLILSVNNAQYTVVTRRQDFKAKIISKASLYAKDAQSSFLIISKRLLRLVSIPIFEDREERGRKACTTASS